MFPYRLVRFDGFVDVPEHAIEPEADILDVILPALLPLNDVIVIEHVHQSTHGIASNVPQVVLLQPLGSELNPSILARHLPKSKHLSSMAFEQSFQSLDY